MRAKPELACDFCRKPEHQVKLLIANDVETCICDECVTLCVKITKERGDGGAPTPADRLGFEPFEYTQRS